MFKTVQENPHIVAKYFDLRTKDYFDQVMRPVFNVDCYWYRQEFAKSMVHWNGLAKHEDKEPHTLLHDAFEAVLTLDETAEKLSNWASSQLCMSASHPAGKDFNGEPRKDLWPPLGPVASSVASSRRIIFS